MGGEIWVYTTREMFSAMESKSGKKSWFSRGKARSVFSIRVPEAVEGVDAELPIDPYVLGAWLGDGHSCCGIIYKSASDLAEMFPNEPILRFESDDSSRCPHVKPHGLTSSLRSLNLLQNKHIPSMYLNASKSQRIELLRGLMDTDGIEGACHVDAEVAEANERRLFVALFVGDKEPCANDEKVDSIFGIRRRVFGNRLLYGFASVQT